VPTDDSFVAYRIERHAPDMLRLSRNDCLVDEDVERAGDNRADIERWGTGVAWAEDYTGIARWDAQPVDGDRWQVLLGVAYRYVQWHFEGVSCWDEIGPDGWASRHIEAGSNGRYLAAAALSEIIAARDKGGADAVGAYERIYGVAPEAAFPSEAEPALTSISGREFVERWIAARHELEASFDATR
jgi:hypothetical protein